MPSATIKSLLPRRKKNMLGRLLFAAIALLIIYAASQLGLDIDGLADSPQPAPPGFYRVIDVADGDTFTVSMNGIEERVRLVGVDTPETHHPSKPVQCFGPEASSYAKQLLENDIVRLEADTQQPNRDRYSRLLRYAYLPDGRELNELLVSQGYALATNFNTSRKQQFKDLQTKAQTDSKGLWAVCRVTEQNGILQTDGPKR